MFFAMPPGASCCCLVRSNRPESGRTGHSATCALPDAPSDETESIDGDVSSSGGRDASRNSVVALLPKRALGVRSRGDSALPLVSGRFISSAKRSLWVRGETMDLVAPCVSLMIDSCHSIHAT